MKNGLGRIVASVAVLTGTLPTAGAQTGSQAEIAFQGYCQGDQSNQLTNIAGVAANFRTFFTGFGVLTGSLETYSGNGRFRTGDNYIDLNGPAWFGVRWRVRGGDFLGPTALVPVPFTNIVVPDLGAEGVRMEASSASRRYTLFYGVETLASGVRIPFRIRVPQHVLGASVVDKIGDRLEVGVRTLHLSANPQSFATNLFAPGQDFRASTMISTQALYQLSSNLELYGEATASSARAMTASSVRSQKALSFTVGPAWRSHKLTVRANYIREAASYLPLAGYFLGDRSGPYVEVQYKPIEKADLFASVSDYRNNLDNSPEVAALRSLSSSAGVSVSLPFRLSASAQLSDIDFSTKQPGTNEWSRSRNQQLIATLGKAIRNHNVHFSYRHMDVVSDGTTQRQQSAEIEDIVQLKRISLGAAVREQQSIAEESKDSLFVRGSAELHLTRFSVYAYLEHGNDLANRTVFLTNTFQTSVVGGAARLSKHWNLRVEASRNRLTAELNPQNVFLLQNQGAFAGNVLTATNQWTVYFRLTKSIRWGPAAPESDLDRYLQEHIPIFGAIDGKVVEQASKASEPAKDVAVALDDGRVTVTDRSGLFHFSRVPEGRHRLSIALNGLPAEYDPGTTMQMTVDVKSKRIATAELDVTRLASVSGRIVGPPATSLDGIIVKLLPAARYTTPRADGSFAFFNLPEGEYDVVIDRDSLPEFAVLNRTTAHVTAKGGSQPEEASFEMSINKPEKPIHRSFEKQR